MFMRPGRDGTMSLDKRNIQKHNLYNGWISRTCKMKQGIRQGCQISAIL